MRHPSCSIASQPFFYKTNPSACAPTGPGSTCRTATSAVWRCSIPQCRRSVRSWPIGRAGLEIVGTEAPGEARSIYTERLVELLAAHSAPLTQCSAERAGQPGDRRPPGSERQSTIWASASSGTNSGSPRRRPPGGAPHRADRTGRTRRGRSRSRRRGRRPRSGRCGTRRARTPRRPPCALASRAGRGSSRPG